MTYKKKAALLSALAAALALAYILTLVFDPGKRGNAAFAWLPSSLTDMADRMEIYGPGGPVVLSRKNNVWVIAGEGYPVKQGRVEDLFAALTRRQAYSLRAASAGAREKLGVTEENAMGGSVSRIHVLGGAGLPLLDLLIGGASAMGVYMRRAGANEIYSGEDHFTLYTDSGPASWYDLRLFPPSGATGAAAASQGQSPQGRSPPSAAMVQQAEVRLPDGSGAFVLRRGSGGWTMPDSEGADLENTRVEAWLRSVLEAEADDFSPEASGGIEGSINLRLGDGTAKTLLLGPANDEGNRIASVSAAGPAYLLPERTVNRLFRERSYFLK